MMEPHNHFKIYLLHLLLTTVACDWQADLNPLSVVNDEVLKQSALEFLNLDSADRVDIVLPVGEFLLIGSRNTVVNYSLTTYTQQRRISWSPTIDDKAICRATMKSEEDCQNYVRVLLSKDNGQGLLVCGTNAFKPMCRSYQLTQEIDSPGEEEIFGIVDSRTLGYEPTEEQTGMALCPYDRQQNNTAVLVDNDLYSATVADMSGRDALIFKVPMRTEQYDSQWLNEPSFVKSLSYGDKVYFFFRETAVEHINCGKAIYSRVARVCKNDQGGSRVLRNTWTSFFKARLNCSIPGDYPFYFDEIQSVSDLGTGNFVPSIHFPSKTEMVYAVFNTPRNSISGSAVCAFNMADISRSFEGQFKEQKNPHSAWLPVRDRDTPRPHPAKTCANDSMSIPDQTLNFIKSHPLMDRAVPSWGGQPVLVQTSFRYRLTQIAVDWQVHASDRFYDVLFIGTDDGRVIKAVNTVNGNKIETVVIEDIAVFSDHSPITQLYLHRHGHRRQLIVVGYTVKTIDLHRCHLQKTCRECVHLRDPYCSWFDDKCQHSKAGLQSIDYGKHPRCPLDEIIVEEPIIVEEVVEQIEAAPPPSIAITPEVVCPPCVCTTPPPLTEPAEKAKISRKPLQGGRATTTTEHAMSSSTTLNVLDKSSSTHMLSTQLDNRINLLPQQFQPGEVRASSQSSSENDVRIVLAATIPTIVALVVGFVIGNLFQLCWRTRKKRKQPPIFMRNLPERTPIPPMRNKEQNQYELTLNRHPHPTSLCSSPPANVNVTVSSPKVPDKHVNIHYSSLTRYPPQHVNSPTSPMSNKQHDGVKWYL